MPIPDDVIQQLQKMIQDNVNRYFFPLKPAEKTAEKVKHFAQKQLDFFISGIAKESPDLRAEWAKGHPYHAHLRLDEKIKFFEVQISTDDSA